MFTGIIEETGAVQQMDQTPQGIRLGIEAKVCARGLKIGQSLAVNGCCLTAVKIVPRGPRPVIEFDLLEETWRRTNFQFKGIGAAVNLERSLPAGGRFDGHFVTGHIDGLGRIERWEQRGSDRWLEISTTPSMLRQVAFKGSVAVDGISLTVAGVDKKSFGVWIIPHTYQVTALREYRTGDRVNLETDILAKYVERLWSPRARRRV